MTLGYFSNGPLKGQIRDIPETCERVAVPSHTLNCVHNFESQIVNYIRKRGSRNEVWLVENQPEGVDFVALICADCYVRSRLENILTLRGFWQYKKEIKSLKRMQA